MAPLFLVLLAALPVFAVPDDKDLVPYRDYRGKAHILGGVATRIEEFPFLVSLVPVLNSMTRTCAGTIITREWVLTAEHCLKDVVVDPAGVPYVDLQAGSTYFYGASVSRRATEVVSHHFKDDIALIKVDEPWPVNGYTISVARLPQQGESTPSGSPAWIVGWGETEGQQAPSSKLMKQKVQVISNTVCWFSYVWTFSFVTDKQMCTLYDAESTAPAYTLQGDSGGPVVVNEVVVGIVSWGSPPLPDVHVRVSSYIEWIEEHVGPLPRTNS